MWLGGRMRINSIHAVLTTVLLSATTLSLAAPSPTASGVLTSNSSSAPSLINTKQNHLPDAPIKNNNYWGAQGGKYASSGRQNFTHQLALETEARYSDNGRRATTNTINEWQDEIGMRWNLGYDSPITKLNANYQWRHVDYTKDSQADDNYLIGESIVGFNDATGSYGLVAGHNQHRVLQNIEAADVSGNKEDKRVLFISPFSRVQITPRDQVQLSFDYRDLQHEVRQQYDYDQATIAIDYQHQINKITGVSFNLSETRQSYGDNDYYDYDIQRSTIMLWRSLRHFQYKLTYGLNKVDTLGGNKTQPLYGITLSFNYPIGFYSIKYDNFITDVSESSLEQDDLYGLDWQLNNLGSQSVNRERLHLHVASEIFSPTFIMLVNWIYEKDEYLSIDEQQDTHIASLSFEYKLKPLHKVYSLTNHIKRDAKNNIFQSDFDYYRYEVGYQYHWMRKSDVTAYFSDVGRRSSDARLYDEKVVGIRFYHQFL